MPRLPFSTRSISVLDAALVVCCNRACRFRLVRSSFRIVSRLGDGVFWYALMAALALSYRAAALPAVARMATAGIAGVAIYKLLKRVTSRPRPCGVVPAVTAHAPPLDAFSFPSGHTLHAVSFSTIAGAYFPELSPLLFSFAALVAASRPILGLHYPSDVAAGAAIGWLVAQVALAA
jgi:undecaprenyl-diphosphatase